MCSVGCLGSFDSVFSLKALQKLHSMYNGFIIMLPILCMFQGAAHFYNESSCFPNRPKYKEEMAAGEHYRRKCFLLLRQHTEYISHHQCGGIKGKRQLKFLVYVKFFMLEEV